MDPFYRVDDFEDYANKVQRLNRSQLGFAQLRENTVYLSVSHALCDGGFLKHFVGTVLPKLMDDENFRGEMHFPPDILKTVHPEFMKNVGESSVLALYKD